MTTLAVRVWSDIVCPWATLALDTLHAVAEQNDCSLDIEHRSFPLELFNEEGTSKPLLDVEMAGIAGLRTRLGWQPWASPDSTFPVTSLPVLAAVRATAARSGNRAADELDTALRRAFFAESRCISLTSVILDVAAGLEHIDEEALAEDIAAGRGMQEVFDDWRQAPKLDVAGSPQLEASGSTLANPGVQAAWSNDDETGFLRLQSYDDSWAHELVRSAGA